MRLIQTGSVWLPWIGGFCALVCTLIFTPLVIRIAHRRNWIARPRKDRWHEKPTALMGGIALFASATLVAVLLFGIEMPWPVWLGASIMFLTGFVDDLKAIRPGGKLVSQVLATGMLLYAGYAFGQGLPFWVFMPLTFLWIVGITNAINLLDNMDGLAAGVSGIAALVLAAFAGLSGDITGFGLAMIVAGAASGFLFFNFKPASIFMGDSGSMFLGYIIAALSLMIQSDAPSTSPFAVYLVSIMVMAIPIFDTTLVTIMRTMAGRSISQGGRDHSSHRLVFLGLSEKRAVLTLYGICGLFGGMALLFHFTQPMLFYALFLLLLVALGVFGVYLASIDVYRTEGDLGFFSTRAYLLNGKFFSVLHALFGHSWKASFGVFADLLLVAGAFVLAHYLRFENGMTSDQVHLLERVLPAIIVVKISVFYMAGLYRGIWRHAGTSEMVRILKATGVSSGLVYVVTGIVGGFESLSVSLFVIDWILISILIGSMRFGLRGLRQFIASQRRVGKPVILYGAGDAGALALRELRQNPGLGYRPIGFVDDDLMKHGMVIQGLPILGSFRDLPRIIAEHRPKAFVISASRMTEARRTEVCVECTRFDVDCLTFQLNIDALPTWSGLDTLVDAETNGAHRK